MEGQQVEGQLGPQQQSKKVGLKRVVAVKRWGKEKMKLERLTEIYENRTGKLSDVTRQLALAGIAIIWVFKKEIGTQTGIPKDLF